MLRSLVGSEMCIRDRSTGGAKSKGMDEDGAEPELRQRRPASVPSKPAKMPSSKPAATEADNRSGLSTLQSLCQWLASHRVEITSSSRMQGSPMSEYLSAQTGNLSEAFTARKERLQALQARSREWWASSKWRYSMENPMDLSFIPPWRYVWDELKHALFMMLVSLTLLYYFPYTFALLSAILVNLAYYVSRMVLSDVPRLIYNPANPHTAAILSKCPMIFRKFFPTMWAWGAKVQTGMFAIWPFPLWVLRGRVEYHRELLSLEDGGTCLLYTSPSPRDS
eukprot:TRINITY_DN2874_c0_g1_i3.p1 TRINITY_DN2874_c0_g1~~TRINITY_DN2874_c0_g1_i3.p1  ORF type:complete len:280 (-),score=52.53 TRINITY_DN2874_c0_g1_i3:101-940(-)